MHLSRSAAAIVCAAGALIGAEFASRATRLVSEDAVYRRPVLPPRCEECPRNCRSHVNACKDGSVMECYLAAACLCQCNLDSGGCENDKKALRQCVENNRREARELGPPEP